MLPWRVPPPPRELDVVAIRAASGYGQASFASMCGVSIGTLRNWEQGRRKPTGPARALLAIIAHDVEAYRSAAIAAIDASAAD
jgi:DNA-binding transcriptional regulator YiaG